jgi:uncharacterized protein (DUF1330 family)
MKYYAVGRIDVEDPSWVKEYVANVTAIVERRGGRYLARTARIDTVEGEQPAPQVFLIIEWPTKEQADAFYESEQYRPYREARRGGSRSEFVLVAGEDINGVAKIS